MKNATHVHINGVPLEEYITEFYFGLNFQIYHTLTILSCTFGLVTNILNIAILTRPAMKSPMNFLLTSLAISDIVFVLARACWSIAYYICPTRNGYVTAYTFMFVNGLYPIQPTAMFSSEWLNATIGVWRFVGVEWPLRTKDWCSMRRARIVVICITVSSFLINLPYVFLTDTETYDLNGTSVTILFPKHFHNTVILVQLYNIGILGLATILPILIASGITIYLVRRMCMYVNLRKRQNISVIEHRMDGINSTTLMLTIMLFIFILTYAPSSVLFIAYYVPIVKVVRLHNIFLLLQTVDKFTTFFVYYFMSIKFREAYRSIFSLKMLSTSLFASLKRLRK